MGQLHASKLTKKSKDPEVWISELEFLRSRLAEMGTTVNGDFLILHILNNLPNEYDNVVENLEERVDSVLNPLGIEDVCQKLSEKYEKMRLRKKFKEDSDDDDERAMFAAKFKGRCNKCGKFGDKAKDCPFNVDSDKEKNQKKKFTGKCFHCGKVGHKEVNCWIKHGKLGERANTTEEDNDVESDEETVLISMEETIDFAGITFTVPEKDDEEKNCSTEPRDKTLMTNEGTDKKGSDQMWIGDTGATCHMTYEKEGLINL